MTALSAVRAHGAAGTRIAAELREEILAGRYAPGDRIRQEELADRHGASRLPVREALRMLEAEGLVTLVANTGAWVTELSPAECQELYLIRERLEPLLLEQSIPVLPDGFATQLEPLAAAMERTDDVEEFLRLDREFHLSCYAPAETALLGELVARLWNQTQHYRRLFTRIARAEGDRSFHHEHALLIAAIATRDAYEAGRVLSSHIRHTRLELARHSDAFRAAAPA